MTPPERLTDLLIGAVSSSISVWDDGASSDALSPTQKAKMVSDVITNIAKVFKEQSDKLKIESAPYKEVSKSPEISVRDNNHHPIGT